MDYAVRIIRALKEGTKVSATEVAKKEHLPQHIVFYGEGVKLTTKGSESLEDLLELEKRGVKILSCGICLDYYDLDDYLKVGGTTTMSEVIDIMTNSDLVVEP